MKKFLAIALVLTLTLALAPAAFADNHPEECSYGLHISNGDGTHTAICSYGAWHRMIEKCWSDNNKNGKCDFCGQIMAELEPLTAGTPVELTAEMLGGFEPGAVNVSFEVEDDSIAAVGTVDGVRCLIPFVEGETLLKLFVSDKEARVMKLVVLPAPEVEEPAEETVVEEAAEEVTEEAVAEEAAEEVTEEAVAEEVAEEVTEEAVAEEVVEEVTEEAAE